MTAKSRSDGIRLKVKRTKKHIGDLDSAMRTFIEGNPYTLAAKPHPVAEIQHATLYVSDVKSVPDDISPIIGDAVHNLRTALDYLMWQLVEAGGGAPDKSVYFPIAETAKQYQSAIGNPEIQKIAHDARPATRAKSFRVKIDAELCVCATCTYCFSSSPSSVGELTRERSLVRVQSCLPHFPQG